MSILTTPEAIDLLIAFIAFSLSLKNNDLLLILRASGLRFDSVLTRASNNPEGILCLASSNLMIFKI